MERSELFTAYTIKQAQTIKHALEAQGFCDPERWPGYLDRITRKMRAAAVMEYRTVREPLPRSSKAAKQLRGFAKALDRAAREYSKLCPELQLMIDDAVPTIPGFSVLKASFPTRIAEQLASSARFTVWLQAMREAAEQTAGTLAPHPAPVSPEALRLVPAELAKVLLRQNPRKQAGLFQASGAPRKDAVRRATLSLCRIFHEATGIPPSTYTNAGSRTGSGGKTPYGGNFYAFALAALAPVGLVERKTSLSEWIVKATQTYRKLSGHGKQRHRPKVNSPAQ